MRQVRRACRCGATLNYTDESWRVQEAIESWETQHTGSPHEECEYLDAVNAREARERREFEAQNQGRN